MSDYVKPGARLGQEKLRFSTWQITCFRTERMVIRIVRILIGAAVLWMADSVLDNSRYLLDIRFADLSPLDLGSGILIGLLGLGMLWLALYIAFGPGKSKYEAEKKWRSVIEFEKYARSIQDRVRQNWSPPANANVASTCILDVYQRPSGEVQDVHIRVFNGDAVLKTSIETAIQQSLPLPKPPASSRSQRHLEIFFNPTVAN